MKKSDILHEYFSRLGRKAVQARMKKVSPEERSRIASEAAKVRWSGAKAKGEGKSK